MNKSCWLLKGECLDVQPAGYQGFVYKITNTIDGRIYIGKKVFTFSKKKKISKKTRVATKTRKKSERVQVDGKWLDYWGSSKELMADIALLGKDKFTREILHLCTTKQQLSYYEVVEILNNRTMFVPSYNGWVSFRVFKNKFLTEII